ncbi:efflux transporter, RND family, MFP subunit [compost metagenome]
MANAPLGATVTLQIPDGEHSSEQGLLQVPIGALHDAGKGHGVWVIQGEPAQVHWQPVVVRHLDDEHARISAQFKQGERIVALGVHLLREGQQVRQAGEAAVAAVEGVRP